MRPELSQAQTKPVASFGTLRSSIPVFPRVALFSIVSGSTFFSVIALSSGLADSPSDAWLSLVTALAVTSDCARLTFVSFLTLWSFKLIPISQVLGRYFFRNEGFLCNEHCVMVAVCGLGKYIIAWYVLGVRPELSQAQTKPVASFASRVTFIAFWASRTVGPVLTRLAISAISSTITGGS